jgi:sugar/nucleoside kinase (ribokinase family)
MTSENMHPVAIVGNLNLDIKTSPIPASPGILADGETSIEQVYETVGGGGANTALASALMGGQVHFCCPVGQDSLGRRLVGFLQRMGVQVHPAYKPVATGRSIALTWDTHQRHFVSSLPNNALLEEADIDLDALAGAGCKHLYRADVWFGTRMLDGANGSLLRRARQMGMQTSLDVNWDPLWNTGRANPAVLERIAALKAVLPFVSFVHGNERELAFFTGCGEIRQSARQLQSWGAKAVIIHRGARGCAAAAPEGWYELPACPVTRAVTETGTGDVFSAAFLLWGELPLAQRLQRCAEAAAQHMQAAPNYIPPLGNE